MHVVRTLRLVLRQLESSDAEFILELLNDPAFVQFVGDKEVRNLDDARAYILQGPIASYARHGFGLYAICLHGGPAVGICGLMKREGLDDVDLGFALLPRYRSLGYAVEAASAILTHARRSHGLRRIVAIAVPQNVVSIAVLEKIGLKFERTIRLAAQSPELKLFGSVDPGTGS